MVGTITYSRSQLCNRLQRMFSVYFKFKGLTAKGCDTLHALGLTMSSKWTTDAVAKISAEAMKEVQELIESCFSFLSYDNVYMTFRVFSQSLDKHDNQTAGTAATVYVKPNVPRPSPEVISAFQQQKRSGMQEPLSPLDVDDLARKSEPAIHRAKAYHVLQVLLNSPEFDRSSYHQKDSSVLDPPPPVAELPCGPEHITLQYMLGSLPIPEATYEDNDKVITNLLEQLGYDLKNLKELFQMTDEHLQFIVGDQLTVERIRGLQRLLCQERNAYERMDYVKPDFGWLHFQMALAKSLHKQYFGTDAGAGLKHAFTLLNRLKGLERRVTQGPFHDNLEHALYDVLEAHLRVCWTTVSGVNDLSELRCREPEELASLSEQIVREFASSQAMMEISHGAATVKGVDEKRVQTVMFLRDVLLYVVLDRAIKFGDVGMMEGIIPHTLLRFIGGKHSNYTVECLELLQGLHREWPSEIRYETVTSALFTP